MSEKQLPLVHNLVFMFLDIEDEIPAALNQEVKPYILSDPCLPNTSFLIIFLSS